MRLIGLFTPRTAPPLGTPRRILILQLQQLGDTVVFSPTLRALRERFVEAEIDLVASPIAAQLYAKSPYLNRIYRADGWGMRAVRMRPLSLIPVLRAIRARRYDWVIADATEHSLRYALAALLTGARVRIGFDVDSRGLFFTHRLELPGELPLAECNLAIALAVGANAERRREEIAFDANDDSRVASLLGQHGISASTPIAVFHPGSNWQSKLWYADRFARVADALSTDGGCAIVFVGTSREAGDVEATRRAMNAPSVSLVGQTSITELAALCARASLFIGTDSGPRNVAGAVGTRTVVVMSAQEDTSRWFGYRPAEAVIRADARCKGCYFSTCAHRVCMAAISEAEVISACLRQLAARGDPSVLPSFMETPVPLPLYAAVAGSPDADCAELRLLAKATPVV